MRKKIKIIKKIDQKMWLWYSKKIICSTKKFQKSSQVADNKMHKNLTRRPKEDNWKITKDDNWVDSKKNLKVWQDIDKEWPKVDKATKYQIHMKEEWLEVHWYMTKIWQEGQC